MEPIDPNDLGPVGSDGTWGDRTASRYAPYQPNAPYQPYAPYPPYAPNPAYAHYRTAGYGPLPLSAPARGRRGLIIGLCVAAVLVAAAISAVIATSGSKVPAAGPPLPIPPTLNEFHQRTDAVVDRFRSSFAQDAAGQSGELARFLRNGQLAVYTAQPGDENQPTLVMLLGRASAYPHTARAGLTGQAFGGFGTPGPYDAGDHGGSLQCATSTNFSVPESACVWSDTTSVGLLVAIEPDGSLQDLADLTNQARATVDS